MATLGSICIYERLHYQSVRNAHAAMTSMYSDYFELKVYLAQYDFYDRIKYLIDEPEVFVEYEAKYMKKP